MSGTETLLPIATAEGVTPPGAQREGDRALIAALEAVPEGTHVVQGPDGSIVQLDRDPKRLWESVSASEFTDDGVVSVHVDVYGDSCPAQPVVADFVRQDTGRDDDTAANRNVFGDTVHMGGRRFESPQYADCVKASIAQRIQRSTEQVGRAALIEDLALLLRARQQELEASASTVE